MSTCKNTFVQEIARRAMVKTTNSLRVGMSEFQIVSLAEACLREEGAESFWYHNVGALVLLGKERSLLSVSGRDYRPSSDILLQDNDLVTLDLSPQVGTVWGDYARTVYMENGRALLEPDHPSSPDFSRAYDDEMALHEEMIRFCRPDTTFHQVWEHMNTFLRARGLKNMDFHGNMGHTIEEDPDDRLYLEEGNHCTLGETGRPFTFEPHISREGSPWAVKRENIYIFGEDGHPAAI